MNSGMGQRALCRQVTTRVLLGEQQGSLRTCIQKQLDDLEVGVGHTVVEGGVPIAVGHVDDVAEDLRGDSLEGGNVVTHHGRHSGLLTGHAEPLMLEGVQTEPLPKHQVAVSFIYSSP